MTDSIKDLAPEMPTTYLCAFFAEKDIPEVSWTLTDNDGVEHHLSNLVVIEHIACVSVAEAKGIAGVLRKIDFANGNVNHFFKHLAGALINR